MALERTYAMIKPGAVKQHQVGKILEIIEQTKFSIKGMRLMQFSQELAKAFYGVHSQRPFFDDLIKGICAGPVVALVLEKDNAIADWRLLIGATDPSQASIGTIRQMFGVSIDENVVHGSDGEDTAKSEISLIFPEGL